eukprot:615569-Hanusia_phi.AAC.1
MLSRSEGECLVGDGGGALGERRRGETQALFDSRGWLEGWERGLRLLAEEEARNGEFGYELIVSRP